MELKEITNRETQKKRYYIDNRRVSKEIFDYQYQYGMMYMSVSCIHGHTAGNYQRSYISFN